MWRFGVELGREQRGSVEDPRVPISNQKVMEFFGLDTFEDSALPPVTIESALGVPAIWAATNFMSGTLAGLPLKLYRRSGEGREVLRNTPLYRILHDAPNEETSSFEWRKYIFEQAFTGGRAVSFIERTRGGSVENIWPLEPQYTEVIIQGGRKFYRYTGGEEPVTYNAGQVIDIPFMLKQDRAQHRSPIMANKPLIQLALAVTKYGAKFFQNGGVPPFAVSGPFKSPQGLDRASEDLQSAIKKSAKENRAALTLPEGHEIKNLGVDPEKGQMVEVQRFLIEQIARIYSLPPTFLQDLTHGTFSNTEQQDLHFVKHTIKRWVEQFEQELNLKLFGRNSRSRFVEMNLDGLLRGDFKTRMEGYAQGIQNAVMKPNEARRRENLPDDPQGELLLVQGATVPIGQAGDDDDGS